MSHGLLGKSLPFGIEEALSAYTTYIHSVLCVPHNWYSSCYSYIFCWYVVALLTKYCLCS
uniref:Uncharacterized protein n=1 Tax=Rhizophora mucronata TaxID=61149 RepID=A0A2P2IZA8_RHIMU